MPKYDDDFYYDYTPKGKSKSNLSEDEIISREIDRDISSYSKGTARKSQVENTPVRSAPKRQTASIKKAGSAAIDKYGNFCLKGLGNIIKVLAFIVAFAIIIMSLIVGLKIFRTNTGLSSLSYLSIIGGTVFAALLFFPLYGIGHIICQNNEILKAFKEFDE